MHREIICCIILVMSLNIIASQEHINKKMFEENDRVVVYSHGFGEDSLNNGSEIFSHFSNRLDGIYVPKYPDANAALSKAVFYTQPAVMILASKLADLVTQGATKIVLVGKSCGAGTAINCLAKLSQYDQNKEYFNGSSITSKVIADNIITAINNGAFIQTVPFLGIHKANLVAIPSGILAAVTTIAMSALASSYVTPTYGNNNFIWLTALWLGVLGNKSVGNRVKKVYAHGIRRTIVRWFTNNNYQANHIQPIDAVEQLRGIITCPILLDIRKNDRVLQLDEDTIRFYEALKGERTHIILTNDGWHNSESVEFRCERINFYHKYMMDQDVDMSGTQPSIEELRQQIYPGLWLTRVLKENKFLIFLAILFSIKPIYGLISQ